MPAATATLESVGPRYKWTALSNTTLGMFMASLDSSIVLISLPAIFRGIHLDPLTPGNIGYLLWMLMGYLVVTAVLVVTFGRLGDMFGRVRMYNAGFAVFTVASIALSVTPGRGGAAAMWLIVWRVVQGIGGALLMANSTAILTDAFPADERGKAMGRAAIEAVLTGKPVSLTAFAAKAVEQAVGEAIATHDIEAIFVFSGQMAQYIPPAFQGRVVMDFVDVDSAKFAAYAEDARAPMRWMMRREARLLGAFERAVASGKPALVEIKLDPDAITPATTLSAIREKALTSKR